MADQSPRLILASGSAARLRLLQAAGLDPLPVRPLFDEDEAKAAFKAEAFEPEAAAMMLAEMKAAAVARRQDPADLVVGSDQLLVTLDGDWLDKPADRAAAAVQLGRLQGVAHRLVTAATVYRGGNRIWGRVQSATLTLRPLSSPLIEAYLDAAGDAVLACVGAYQIEGLGAQLMARVEGDAFAVQGLPLLPLLGFLREHGHGLVEP